MGCFLACFGFTETKKQRRKPGKKTPTALQHDHQSYVPLDSDVEETLTSAASHIDEKPKEPAIVKLKKKVRFNLNVKAYEPIPDVNDEEDMEFDSETKDSASLQFEECITSYPANYRYQNCRDSDDDEDLELDSDLDEIEESDEEDDDICSNRSDDAWELSDHDDSENQVPNQEQTSVVDLLESKSNARDRSQYVSSVLNPVENLSQWRAVKAKATTTNLKLQKENVVSKQDRNSLTSSKNAYSKLKVRDSNGPGHRRVKLAVDASLTNWLSDMAA